ncbi:septum formation initiator family protein [Candidatus Kaiserbacteria bacterium]|nr:septum formation initiator family protein [Candidatus Kaiserbacteria bacterium]
MFDFHEKRKIRSWLYSKTTIVILFILAILLSFSVYERFVVERKVAEKRAEREGDLLRLEERAAALEENIEHLESDRGLEEELRSRFDVAKEGERVIIIVDSDEENVTKTLPSSRKEHKRSFIDRLKFWE